MWRVTVLWSVLAMVGGATWTGQSETTQPPPASQPATMPDTHRQPTQAQIIENLLRDRDKPRAILPREPEVTALPGVASSQPAAEPGSPGLLPDGAILVERPGRLVRENGKPMFVFYSNAGTPQLQTMEILPNGFLEALEHQAELGHSEFIISGDVTRYRNRNYVLLTKVLQRVQHGNVGP